MMKLLLFFVLINYFMLQPVSGFEVSPERHELEYLNRKYLSYLSVSFRKRARNGPYYINLALETHTACGNNVKLKMALYEFLSGRYILTPVQVAYKLCDFLYKEPFFGQMYAKQLTGNWSCPFPPGKYNFTNLVMHLENFPHYLPFTYNSLIVRTCVDVQGVIAATNEEMFRMKTSTFPTDNCSNYFHAFEVSPERHELEYYNRKYLRHMSATFRKRARKSPHYVNLALELYVSCGNNHTLKMTLYEFLSGHYILTPIQGVYKLCDFLYKEPFFGQMYAKQLTGNWSSPFPPGKYNFTNLVIHLEKFPHHLPFTYSSLIVTTRVDVQGVITSTDEEVFRWKTYVKVTQKMEKPKRYNG